MAPRREFADAVRRSSNTAEIKRSDKDQSASRRYPKEFNSTKISKSTARKITKRSTSNKAAKRPSKFAAVCKITESWSDSTYLETYLVRLETDFAECKQDRHHYSELFVLGGHPPRSSRYLQGLQDEITAVKEQLEMVMKATEELESITQTFCRAYQVDIVHGRVDPALIEPALLALPGGSNIKLPVQKAAEENAAAKAAKAAMEARTEVEEGEVAESSTQESNADGQAATSEADSGALTRTQTAVGSDFEGGEDDDEYDPVKDFTTLLDDSETEV